MEGLRVTKKLVSKPIALPSLSSNELIAEQEFELKLRLAKKASEFKDYVATRKYETKFLKENSALRALIVHARDQKGLPAAKAYCLPIMNIKIRHAS